MAWLEAHLSGGILKWHNIAKTVSRYTVATKTWGIFCVFHSCTFFSWAFCQHMEMTRVGFTLTGTSGWHPLTQLVVHKSDNKQRACPAVFVVLEMPDCVLWNWPPRSSRCPTALKQMDVLREIQRICGVLGFLIELVMIDSRAAAAGSWAGKWAKPRLWQIRLPHDVLRLQQGSASINKNCQKMFLYILNCFSTSCFFRTSCVLSCSDAPGPHHWWEWASKLRCESGGGVLVVSLCLKARQRKSCGAEQRLSVCADTLTLRSRMFRGQRLETAQQIFVLPLWKSVLTNLHIFNICIIPTIQLIPTLAIYNGMAAFALKQFLRRIFTGAFLKRGRQAHLSPSQHNFTQNS